MVVNSLVGAMNIVAISDAFIQAQAMRRLCLGCSRRTFR